MVLGPVEIRAVPFAVQGLLARGPCVHRFFLPHTLCRCTEHYSSLSGSLDAGGPFMHMLRSLDVLNPGARPTSSTSALNSLVNIGRTAQ